jgi:hypothetical protein
VARRVNVSVRSLLLRLKYTSEFVLAVFSQNASAFQFVKFVAWLGISLISSGNLQLKYFSARLITVVNSVNINLF